MPGPRNLQAITVEYLVTGALDGVTPAEPIDFETTPFNLATQVYEGGTQALLGLIDPDLISGGGSIGSRQIPFLWIDTAAVGQAGAAVEVVGVRAADDVALQKVVENLVGQAGAFVDRGFQVAQGSAIRIQGFTAPAGTPIRVRISICVPKRSSDYSLQVISDDL